MDKLAFVKRHQLRIPARWHMTLICLATIAVGVLASKLILILELAGPAYRYGSAVLVSYATFFILVYIWLKIHFGVSQTRDLNPDFDFDILRDSTPAPEAHHFDGIWKGSGGNFSGGGASAEWNENPATGLSHLQPPQPPTMPSSLHANQSLLDSTKSESALEIATSAGDLDEGVVILLVIAVFAAVFGAAGYIIYQAPEILLEAAFEAALGAGLLRQTQKMQSEGWHVSILKRTWWLFALILAAAITFGAVIKSQCPEANSFRDYREICWGKAKPN